MLELVGYVVKATKLTNYAQEPLEISGYCFPFVLNDKDLIATLTLFELLSLFILFIGFNFILKTLFMLTGGHYLKCLASRDAAIEFSDGYNDASATNDIVFCVLRWWKIYQLLEVGRM